jgi:dienelactone hydrolase
MKAYSVDYKEGSTACEGWAAYDDASGAKRPGVLLFPDWTGVGDYAQKRAAMLVQLGYAVFCVDVYGKGIRPSGPEACTAEMMKYLKDRPTLRARAKAGFEQLSKLPVVDGGKTAAIGYCFGGLCALELARTGAALNGVVGFHCSLNTPNPGDAKAIKAKVLVMNGADDPLVPDTETAAFEKEMRDAKVDWQLHRFGNTVHSYTQWFIPPGGSPAAYNEKSDKRSWVAMQDFFKEIFA